MIQDSGQNSEVFLFSMYSNSKFERNKANVDSSESHSEIQFPFGVEPNMNSMFS